MRVSFPHIGLGSYAFETFLATMGVEAVLPPPSSRRTLELGARHAPELVCLPFKITLGNFLEVLDQGVHDLFMAAGPRRCRFGYYHIVQERLLRDLGYDFRLHTVDQYNPVSFVFDFLPRTLGVPRVRVVKAAAVLLAKARLIEVFERQLRVARARDFAEAERRRRPFEDEIRGVKTFAGIRRLADLLPARLAVDGPAPAVRVGITGEIFLVMDSFANRDLEKELGRLGALVVSQRSLYGYLRRLLHIDREGARSQHRARRWLSESPGGEAEKSVGEAVGFAQDGVDGIVHVYPFTCMPENIAAEMIGRIGEHAGKPVLGLSLDEHTAPAGLVTRLEAFVELLRRRRARLPGH